MTAQRLPVPGSDDGQWGDILNGFLEVAHNTDGSLSSSAVASAAPNATGTTKGIVKLAGDLAGTADSPTVPGLTSKASDSSVVHLAGTETITGNKNFTGTLQHNGTSVVDTSRSVSAGTGLTGGGDLSADRSLAVSFGTGAGTVAQGNDTRIVNAASVANNLSDLANASSARTNLGVGFTNNTMANRPAAGSYTGWYFASDINGGTLYYSNGTAWTQVDGGVTWGSGQQLAYASNSSLTFDVAAVGTTQTDVSAGVLQVAVPASSVPVLIHAKIWAQIATGTAASGTLVTIRLYLTDSSNNFIDVATLPAHCTGASRTWLSSIYVAAILPAPVSAGTYKLRANLAAAAPSGLGGATLNGGSIFPNAWIEAVAH